MCGIIKCENDSNKTIDINNIIKEFNPMFSKVNTSIIRTSGYYDKEIKVIYDEKYPKLIEYLKSKNLMTDKLAVENNKKHLLNECIGLVYDNHKDEYDIMELTEVKNVLIKINSYYDLNDARVYVIIKQLIDMILTTYRIQRSAINLPDILERMNNETGESTYYNNPALKLKLEHNMAIVKLISELNKIIEGEKLNINANIQYEVIPASELYAVPKRLNEIRNNKLKSDKDNVQEYIIDNDEE